ncbi:MAG: lanthionine synthetase LanC family protein, partial [Gemmatimonadaceae bacterium]
CNGSAGLVFLWRLAHDVLRTGEFSDLAEAAAWNAWEEPSDTSVSHLCCGSAGRAYAMLAMYRADGAPAWLARGRELYELAVEGLDDSLGPRYSLYKGALGLAVLAHDLAQPELARMPLFELERLSPLT